MMDRLQAEEQLGRISAVALGTGSVKSHVSRAMFAKLDRRMNGHKPPRKASRAALSMMGITVVEVGKGGDG